MIPKRHIFVLAVLLVDFAAKAALPFEDDPDNVSFYAPKAEIIWAATNELPAHLKIYKTGPAKYSPAVQSYVLNLGGHIDTNTGLIFFRNRTNYMMQVMTNVPDANRALELGKIMLKNLEIPTNELSKADLLKPRYYPGFVTRGDPETHKLITEPSDMGIDFRRVIDGIGCLGQEVHFRFETREELGDFDIKWFQLIPVKEIAVATRNELVAWIKEGRARVMEVQFSGERRIKVADIKQITICDVQLSYDARYNFRLEKYPIQLEPYAEVIADIEMAANDRATITLFCPISKEALSRKIQKNKDFNSDP